MRNTFFENAQLYGMPYPVEGGTSISYVYEVWIKKDGKPTEYVKYADNICTNTPEHNEATAFTKECAEQVAQDARNILKEKYANVEVKVVPKSYYETLRD